MTTQTISIHDLAVGDEFRVSNKRVYTSGKITKINRVNVRYQSTYGWGDNREVLHLQIAKWELLGAQVANPNGVFTVVNEEPSL